ncbi:MAG TPA: transcriptional repressor [Acholeplasma sp.]|jgi:Fur family ferric uptake transcriptional regulator|nr:transcriptional repressor [Acholeplasma sp.]
MRMTKHRKAIFSLLEQYKKPMSAEIINQELPKNAMDLSTIYRTLDVLFDNGLVSKSNIQGTMYYQIIKNHEHHHYVMCLKCKKILEFDCHLEDQIKNFESKLNFQIIEHDLTFYGYCESCKQ